MITRGLSCDCLDLDIFFFFFFLGGGGGVSDDPPDPRLATGLSI